MRLAEQHTGEPFTTAPAPKAGLLRIALAGTVVVLMMNTQSSSETPGAYLAAGLALLFGALLVFERPGFIVRAEFARPLVDSVLLCMLIAGTGGESSPFFPLYLVAALQVVRAATFVKIFVATAALSGSYLLAVGIAVGNLGDLSPFVMGPRVGFVALFCVVAGVLGIETRSLESLNSGLSRTIAIEQGRTRNVEILVSDLGPALGVLDIEGILGWTAGAARSVSEGSYAHVAALEGGSHRTVLAGDPDVCPSWWHPAIQRLVLWSCLEGDTVRSDEPVHGIEGFMAVPVGLAKSEKWGAIVVGGKEFDAEDERILKLLAGTVARVLEAAKDAPGGRDPASRLPNRASLLRVLRRYLSRGRALTVIAVEVDGIRRFGRRRGPVVKDALVRRLGERLAAGQRLVFRYEEETFVAVLGGSGESRARAAVSSVERSIAQEAAASAFPLTVSTGIAFAEAGDEDVEGIIETAMRALAVAGGRTEGVADVIRSGPEGDRRTNDVVRAFVATLETRDPRISDHLRGVAEISRRVGSRLHLSPDQIEGLVLGAMLHDVGKIGVPDHILQKPGRLTEEEFEVIRRHPAQGASMLAPIQDLASVLAVVKHHHERFDGEGYPDGLRGGSIPISARIVSAADAFDAMMRDRPYGYGIPREAALEEITRGSGSRFDPEVVAALLETEIEASRSSSAG